MKDKRRFFRFEKAGCSVTVAVDEESFVTFHNPDMKRKLTDEMMVLFYKEAEDEGIKMYEKLKGFENANTSK